MVPRRPLRPLAVAVLARRSGHWWVEKPNDEWRGLLPAEGLAEVVLAGLLPSPIAVGTGPVVRRADGSSLQAEVLRVGSHTVCTVRDVLEAHEVPAGVPSSEERPVGVLAAVPAATEAHDEALRAALLLRLAEDLAHQLNNALTTVLGNADFLALGLYRDDLAQADLAEIRTAAERAARLVHQLQALGDLYLVSSATLRATVLVVDDEPLVLSAMTRLLEQRGYAVLDASGPVVARALVAAGAKFDVLVTDVVMPDATGPELAAELQRVRPGLPVVYVSAYVPGGAFPERRLPGGAGWLSKPFSGDELALAVEAALARPTHRRQGNG